MQRTLRERLWYEFCRSLIVMPMVTGLRVRYYGQHNIPQRGGFLMVGNHQSHLDPPLIGVGCWRQLHFVARQTLFQVPLLGPIIGTLPTIPLDRDGLGLSGIKESLRVLKHGGGLLLFPEGTRSPDGQIRAFRPGFATLAVRTRVPIVPAAIDGAFDAWPRSRNYPLPGRVRVSYGTPIQLAEAQRLDERELVAEVEQRVRRCLAELRQRRMPSDES